MENWNTVFIVHKNGGCYEDAYHYIIGTWHTFKEAMKQAKEVCLSYFVDESELPMTFDEFFDANEGYPDDPHIEDIDYEYTEEDEKYLNTRIDRDGHTVAEFEITDKAFSKTQDDFSSCTIDSYEIGNPDAQRSKTTYVSNADKKGEFHINTY